VTSACDALCMLSPGTRACCPAHPLRWQRRQWRARTPPPRMPAHKGTQSKARKCAITALSKACARQRGFQRGRQWPMCKKKPLPHIWYPTAASLAVFLRVRQRRMPRRDSVQVSARIQMSNPAHTAPPQLWLRCWAWST